MADKQDKHHEDLNKVAVEALKGLHLNPARHLASLLDSGAPISAEVRALLSMSLRGANPFGVVLDISGHEESARKVDSLTKKRRDYKIGKIVERLAVELGPTKSFVEAATRWKPERDSSFYRKRYYYAKKCDDWVSAARLEGGIFADLDHDLMRDIWHLSVLGGYSPPSSGEYARDRAWRLKGLEENFAAQGFSGQGLDEATQEAFSLMEYLLPKPFDSGHS